MQIHVILEPDLPAKELCELGLLAEAQGIAGLWVQNYATAGDAFMNLVPLAQASSRIRLGVVIISPQESHPLKIATSLLTLNEFSRGRAMVTLGRGGEWLGAIGGQYSPKVQALMEALTIVCHAARGKGRTKHGFSVPGKHYRAQYFRTPWVTEDRPALVYAGVTRDRMLAMGAQTADGVMLADLGLPRVAADRVRVIREALAATHRPATELRISNFLGWHVKADPAAVAHEARRELVIRAWLARDWLAHFLTPEENEIVQQNKQAFIAAYRDRKGTIEGVPEEIVGKLIGGLTITSTADRMDEPLQRLHDFAAAGLNEICLRLHDDPADSIRIIGRHVIPRFPTAA